MKTLSPLVILLISALSFSQTAEYDSETGIITVKSKEPIYSINLDTCNEKFVRYNTTYSPDNKTVQFIGVKKAKINDNGIKLKRKIILNIELQKTIVTIILKNYEN